MSRAIFLSSSGDPFILSLVVKLWKERWYKDVDSFWINVNCMHTPRDVLGEMFSQFVREDDRIRIIYHPYRIGNGTPIVEMAKISSEDHVMLLEDDGFIFTPGKVDEMFKRIESGEVDALGSPRGSAGPEVLEGMQKKYNLDYTGYGDVGPNFWPNFFFCKREDLLKLDENFASKEFAKGDYYKEIDHTFRENNYGDTFVWAGIQMRYNGVRFGHIPQFHASPTEIADKRAKVMNWIGEDPYWIHGGSLSSGLGGYLSGSIPEMNDEGAKMEIETRASFWTIALESSTGFGSFREVYSKGIEDLIVKGGLDRKRIQQKIDLYKEMMGI